MQRISAKNAHGPVGLVRAGLSGEQPPQEIELRLFAEPAVLDALEREPLIANNLAGPVKHKHQVGTYFDTSDRRLERRGVNFRVRAVDGGHVQTVKATTGSAGPLTRSEWEANIGGPMPDLEALAASGAGEATGVLLPGDLEALFVTDIHRTARTIAYDAGGSHAALIEVSADRGGVHLAGNGAQSGATRAISELELELRAGPKTALFELALALVDSHRLRVGFAGKAARGYQLLDGTAPCSRKFTRVAIAPAWTVGHCMHSVFHACFKHWIDNERAAEDGSNPGGVHQMRVALRRLRTALALFKPALPQGQRNWLNREAKWLAGSLGPARDWDVFLGQMLPSIEHEDFAAALEPLEKAATRRRAAGYRQARSAIGSRRYTRFVLEFWRWLECHGWCMPALETVREQPVTALANRVLAQRHKQVLKRGRNFAHLSLAERHEVRIAVKKLRYSVEFFAHLYDFDEAKPYRKSLSKLQDALGAMNDAAVAQTLLEEIVNTSSDTGLARAAGIVGGWYTRGQIEADMGLIAQFERWRMVAPFWNAARRQ